MAESADTTIRILLVDDHAMFREGLALVIEKERDVTIMGECSSSAEAIAILERGAAEIVVLDVDLGAERALDFINAARRIDYKGRILILTAGISDQEAIQLVQAGVAGILHKQHSTGVLCSTIRRIVAGEVCLEQPYLKALFESSTHPRTAQGRTLT